MSSVTEHDMVLAFLQAEIDSPDFGPSYQTVLERSGLNRTDLIDGADLLDARANAIRRELLKAVRGYQANKALFAGFPDDVVWTKSEVTWQALARFRYARWPEWVALTNGTRYVQDGAQNIGLVPSTKTAKVNAVTAAVRGGTKYPPLIAVEHPLGAVLVEGHTRATAYVRAQLTDPIAVILGSSPGMGIWCVL